MDKQTNKIRDKILAGLELSSKRLIKFKKARNLEVVISDNGKIKRLSGQQL